MSENRESRTDRKRHALIVAATELFLDRGYDETSVRAIVDAAFVSAGRIIRPAAEATYMMTAVGLVRACSAIRWLGTL